MKMMKIQNPLNHVLSEIVAWVLGWHNIVEPVLGRPSAHFTRKFNWKR
jgi:hypothetical protein